jgi:hypothetical protein
MNILTDSELRYLAIKLLSAPTARTRQERIGASDLANECDRCLAMAMTRMPRAKNPTAEGIWMQAEIGTGIHSVQETRLTEFHSIALGGDERLYSQQVRDLAREIAAMTPGAKAEQHIDIGVIPGYGPVGGTIDLKLQGQIVDWKSADRIKSAFLHDFLLQHGLGPEGAEPRWVKQKDTKAYAGGYKFEYGSSSHAKRVASISFRNFQEAMDGMVHKMNGYHIQQSLYMHGCNLAGEKVVKGTIMWINRDGNGLNDVPSGSRYEDPSAIHDIWPLSFDYHADTALAALDRGARIWARIERGDQPQDFEASDHCFICSFERENVADIAPAIDATLKEAA